MNRSKYQYLIMSENEINKTSEATGFNSMRLNCWDITQVI